MITSTMEHFESQYPSQSREKEIQQVFQFVARGQSCQLISVPGAGRSTVLRLLLHHKELISRHIQHLNKNKTSDAFPHNSFLFIYVNFAEISTFDSSSLQKHIFVALQDALEDSPDVQKEIATLLEKSLAVIDPVLFTQQLKKAFLLLPQHHIVFLFDRFSEFAEKTTSDFFTILKSLRTATGGRLSVVFSTHRPLEDLLPRDHWKDFYEFFVGNHVYVDMYDPVATTFRVQILEKEYGKTIDDALKKEQIKLTGGHGKLMKLSTQILLSEDNNFSNVIARSDLSAGKIEATKQSPPANAWHWRAGRRDRHADARDDNLRDTLLGNILIRGSLLEIWEALTREEKNMLKEFAFNNVTIQQFNNSLLQKLHLPFPLLTEFIKRNLAETLVPKTIRLNEKTNELYYGDNPIADLTATEFKLLTFLIKNPDRVCDRDEIINAVWKDSKTQEGVSDEALDQMIYRVRKKIEDEADNPKHLLTVKGRGYRFIA